MYKILIADDEELIRSLVVKYAKFEGHTVTEAANGMEAVELCRKNDFDIVILDIMMPELDGFSACREIRRTSSVPVILLSARGAVAAAAVWCVCRVLRRAHAGCVFCGSGKDVLDFRGKLVCPRCARQLATVQATAE